MLVSWQFYSHTLADTIVAGSKSLGILLFRFLNPCPALRASYNSGRMWKTAVDIGLNCSYVIAHAFLGLGLTLFGTNSAVI